MYAPLRFPSSGGCTSCSEGGAMAKRDQRKDAPREQKTDQKSDQSRGQQNSRKSDSKKK